MAGPEPVSTVKTRAGDEQFVSKTFIQATMPGVKVFFVTPGDNPVFD
jgi:hypothetical protein